MEYRGRYTQKLCNIHCLPAQCPLPPTSHASSFIQSEMIDSNREGLSMDGPALDPDSNSQSLQAAMSHRPAF